MQQSSVTFIFGYPKIECLFLLDLRVSSNWILLSKTKELNKKINKKRHWWSYNKKHDNSNITEKKTHHSIKNKRNKKIEEIYYQ